LSCGRTVSCSPGRWARLSVSSGGWLPVGALSGIFCPGWRVPEGGQAAGMLAVIPRDRGGQPLLPTGHGESMIYFDNVTKVYGRDVVALKDVNLGVEAGEFVFLVGASGSGKSTMIRLILKEMEPTSGTISVNGAKLSAIPRRYVPKHRRNIGCVFQDFKLLPNKTAAENVAYAMEVTGQKERTIRTRVPQILELVGLGGKKGAYPGQLSGGEQQRVSIARAFVSQPPILIADEPTGNLDPETSVGIMQLLHRINRIGTTVLVATHDREMVDVMRKRVVALEEGRIVRDMVKGGYTSEV
jgi:cell division transport system ATP-binding protein